MGTVLVYRKNTPDYLNMEGLGYRGLRGCGGKVHLHWRFLPAGKMKLEFLENPSSASKISNLFQAHFWDSLEIACWYWPDLARIQATKLGLGRISLNFK